MSDIATLKNNLKNDPELSKRFHSDVLDLLHKHGVDVKDSKVRSQMGLDRIQAHAMSVAAPPSSAIITITQ